MDDKRAKSYSDIDFRKFQADLDLIEKQAYQRASDLDVYYSMFWVLFMHFCFAAGIMMSLNDFHPAAIAMFIVYAMLMGANRHTVWHGGLDKMEKTPRWMRSNYYGHGFLGTLFAGVWYIPADIWIKAHNRVHHYFTSEDGIDADNTVDDIKKSRLPRILKPVVLCLVTPLWAALYALKTADLDYKGNVWKYKPWHIFNFREQKIRKFWKQTLLPLPLFLMAIYGLLFVLFDSHVASRGVIDLAVGITTGTSMLFIGIMVNHAGFDVFRVTKGRYKNKGEFYFQQALTSANFESAGHLWDNVFSFLNYQIEHHLFPKLPVLQYRWVKLRVRGVFERHGVPYNEGPLVSRFLKHTLFYVWSDRSCPELDWDAFRSYKMRLSAMK